LNELDTSHAEALSLARYMAAVVAEIGVEPSAAWHEYGPPSSAYVALPDRSPDDPDRFLMLQWTDEDGWSLAVEPDGPEMPVVLASWPGSVYLPPAELATAVRRAVMARVTIPLRVTSRGSETFAR
jgi:hypothetical protein